MDKTVNENTTKRRAIDWEAVEREYRAGIRSLRDIAGEYGITDTAIRKRAKRDDWERDLSARVATRAEALVRRAEVRTEVRADLALSEREQINVNAQMLADKVINQREDVKRLRNTINSLFEELDVENESKESELAERVRIAKALTETTKIAIELERRILKLDEFSHDETGVRVARVELVALT